MRQKGITPILIIISLVLVLGVGVIIGQSLVTPQNELTPQATLVASIKPTSNINTEKQWLSYKNNFPEYTINYPEGWAIDNSNAEVPEGTEAYGSQVVIYKGDYKVTFSFPSGYGPSMCIFDDQEHLKAQYEFASFCEGDYVEVIDNNSSHRRLRQPSTQNGISWTVYSRETNSGAYVTVPPVSFSAPSNYDENIIGEMDDIVARSIPTK